MNGYTIDLLHNGYGGGISMEPHLAAVFHQSPGEAKEDTLYRSYVAYDRRLERVGEHGL